MKRTGFFAILALALTGCGGEHESTPERAEKAPETVLGLVWHGRSTWLGRFGAVSLRPVGRRTAVAPSWTATTSPDGGTLVLGSAERSVLTFVDAETLRPRGRPLALSGQRWIGRALW